MYNNYSVCNWYSLGYRPIITEGEKYDLVSIAWVIVRAAINLFSRIWGIPFSFCFYLVKQLSSLVEKACTLV